MTFNECVQMAKNGDSIAFSKLYSLIYKDLYYIAYYSLRTKEEAVDTVKETAEDAFKNMIGAKNESNLRAWFIRFLSSKIIDKFKEYKTTGNTEILPQNKEKMSTKEIFSKLTNVERLVLVIWGLYGFEAEKISLLTGLKEAAVMSKLNSAQNKFISMSNINF